jgi:DNA helicase II / ATP-dependent DNA helicase PcrA
VSTALSESESKKGRGGESGIILMTAHASKGLEFDCVCLIGAEEGLFPHSRSMMDKMETEEERRLFYVAMTRTRAKLFISWARNRLVYGGRTSTVVSRFVAEIPETVVKRNVERLSWQERGGEDDWTGETRRIVVPDWEVDKLTKDDFDEIDNW